jgi:serine/threonine protein kinase
MTTRVLAGRWVVEGALAAGGMGSIFRGRDAQDGSAVAIKILKRALVDDHVVRARFTREALSLAKLRDPGIVRVLDCGEAEGDLFTVLELISGETLEQSMQRALGLPSASWPAMDVGRATRIAGRILAALETCHANDIVHRDVKPSNVIVEGDGPDPRVTLIDFGLARIARIGGDPLDKLTETGTVHGTPHYMAPEQCRGEDVGPASDVYSTGVLFYEMLAGSGPYQAKDAATFMAQHLFVEPPPLRDVAPHVPPGIAVVVHAMLSKRPEDRPTASMARRALSSALAGTDPEARAEARAVHRHEVASLSRSERTIGGSSRAPEHTSEPADDAGGAVLVWMEMGDRNAALRGCLSVAGLACTAASDEEPPEVGPRDVVIASASEGLARVRRLRALDANVPVVVVDVGSTEETTEAIRAGASDMLLRDAPDADLVPKVRRLLRRRARR